MIYSLSFAANGLFGFLLILALPHVLAPAAFGLFSLMMMAGLFIYAVFYQWVRVSLLRFFETQERHSAAIRENTFRVIYRTTGACLGTAGLAAAILAGPFWPVAAVTAFVVTQGAFDHRMALARARSRRSDFTRLMLVRGGAGFALALAGAAISGRADVALVGAACANLVAALVVPAGQREGAPRRINPALVRRCLGYGLPLAAGSVGAVLAPFLFRWGLGAHADLESVGIFSLPFDTMQRVAVFFATAINVASFQTLVRTYDSLPARDFQRHASRSVNILALVLLPALAGMALTAESFAEAFVPPAMRSGFTALAPLAVAAAGLGVARHFAVDVLLMIVRRTSALLVSAAVSMAVAAGWIILQPGPDILRSFGMGLVAAQMAGLAVSSAWLWRTGPMPRPGANFIRIAAATAAMTAAVLPLPPVFWLQAATGAAVYGAACLVLNPLELREQIKKLAVFRI